MLSDTYAHNPEKLVQLLKSGILSCEEFSSYIILLANHNNVNQILELLPSECDEEFRNYVHNFDPDTAIMFGNPPFVVDGRASALGRESIVLMKRCCAMRQE